MDFQGYTMYDDIGRMYGLTVAQVAQYVRRLRLPRQKVQDDWSVHSQSFRDAMEREGVPIAPMSQWLRP